MGEDFFFISFISRSMAYFHDFLTYFCCCCSFFGIWLFLKNQRWFLLFFFIYLNIRKVISCRCHSYTPKSLVMNALLCYAYRLTSKSKTQFTFVPLFCGFNCTISVLFGSFSVFSVIITQLGSLVVYIRFTVQWVFEWCIYDIYCKSNNCNQWKVSIWIIQLLILVKHCYIFRNKTILHV